MIGQQPPATAVTVPISKGFQDTAGGEKLTGEGGHDAEKEGSQSEKVILKWPKTKWKEPKKYSRRGDAGVPGFWGGSESQKKREGPHSSGGRP